MKFKKKTIESNVPNIPQLLAHEKIKNNIVLGFWPGYLNFETPCDLQCPLESRKCTLHSSISTFSRHCFLYRHYTFAVSFLFFRSTAFYSIAKRRTFIFFNHSSRFSAVYTQNKYRLRDVRLTTSVLSINFGVSFFI